MLKEQRKNTCVWSIIKQMISVTENWKGGNWRYFYLLCIISKSSLPVLSEDVRKGTMKDDSREAEQYKEDCSIAWLIPAGCPGILKQTRLSREVSWEGTLSGKRVLSSREKGLSSPLRTPRVWHYQHMCWSSTQSTSPATQSLDAPGPWSTACNYWLPLQGKQTYRLVSVPNTESMLPTPSLTQMNSHQSVTGVSSSPFNRRNQGSKREDNCPKSQVDKHQFSLQDLLLPFSLNRT